MTRFPSISDSHAQSRPTLCSYLSGHESGFHMVRDVPRSHQSTSFCRQLVAFLPLLCLRRWTVLVFLRQTFWGHIALLNTCILNFMPPDFIVWLASFPLGTKPTSHQFCHFSQVSAFSSHHKSQIDWRGHGAHRWTQVWLSRNFLQHYVCWPGVLSGPQILKGSMIQKKLWVTGVDDDL